MDRKIIGLALGALLFALCVPAEAQQARKVPRIGYLTATSLSSNVARIDAFRQGLRELGYVEGKNIVIEWRSGEGKLERQGELAAEQLPVPPRKPLLRFPSSWHLIAILLETGSSPA
jgi:putative tryptophan/tyrosine transport system substrate-binding protein